MLGIVALTAVCLWPRAASADIIWCFTDPVLVIEGKAVHIELAVPRDERQTVSSSTLVVTVPANLTAIMAGEGVQNFPIGVTVVRFGAYSGSGPVPVTTTAVINGRPGMPTAVRIWQAGIKDRVVTTGVSGVPMTITFGVS